MAGACRGIGNDLAIALAMAGATVAAAARSTIELQSLVATIGEAGGRWFPVIVAT